MQWANVSIHRLLKIGHNGAKRFLKSQIYKKKISQKFLCWIYQISYPQDPTTNSESINFHKMFDQCVQILQFLFLCHLFSCQKQSHWLKNSWKFKICSFKNWLLDPVSKIEIVKSQNSKIQLRLQNYFHLIVHLCILRSLRFSAFDLFESICCSI